MQLRQPFETDAGQLPPVVKLSMLYNNCTIVVNIVQLSILSIASNCTTANVNTKNIAIGTTDPGYRI